MCCNSIWCLTFVSKSASMRRARERWKRAMFMSGLGAQPQYSSTAGFGVQNMHRSKITGSTPYSCRVYEQQYSSSIAMCIHHGSGRNSMWVNPACSRSTQPGAHTPDSMAQQPTMYVSCWLAGATARTIRKVTFKTALVVHCRVCALPQLT